MQVIIDGKKANFNPAPGMSAYQVAVKNGFTGTETEWLDSLKGAPGEPGTPGKDGVDGNAYSSSKTQVGTYNDKPLYRFFNELTEGSNGFDSPIQINITSIDKIANFHVLCHVQNNSSEITGYKETWGDCTYACSLQRIGNLWFISIPTEWYTGIPDLFAVTIDYTEKEIS